MRFIFKNLFRFLLETCVLCHKKRFLIDKFKELIRTYNAIHFTFKVGETLIASSILLNIF